MFTCASQRGRKNRKKDRSRSSVHNENLLRSFCLRASLINQTRLEAQSQLITDDAPAAVCAHRVGIQEPTGRRGRGISRHEPTGRRKGANAAGQELRVVEDIEELRAELDPHGLAQMRALLNVQV